jgi:hypothetical protein
VHIAVLLLLEILTAGGFDEENDEEGDYEETDEYDESDEETNEYNS